MRPRDLAGLSTPEARLVALPLGLSALAVVGPARLSSLPSLCIVRRVFSRCPACGVTRAMAALLRGDVRRRPRRGLAALVILTFGSVLVNDVRALRAETGRVRTG